MNQKFSALLEWQVKSSVLQRRLLLVVHALAVTALMVSAIASVYKALLLLPGIISGYCYWRAYGPTCRSLTVRYTDAFGWQISENAEYRSIRILKSTVVTRWVIVLHYRLDNRNKYWAIFNDALTDESFRRLIVQLKILGLDDR